MEKQKKLICKDCGKEIEEKNWDDYFQMCIDCIDDYDCRMDHEDLYEMRCEGLSDSGPYITYI
jgi:hypothetical protein